MLGRDGLQQHCEDMLNQRIFLQRLLLTTPEQLKKQDARLFDALSLWKRYPLSEDTPLAFQLIYNPDGSKWLELLIDEDSEQIDEDLILYLAELAIELSSASVKQLILPLVSFEDADIQRLGLKLSLRLQFQLSSDILQKLDPLVFTDTLLYLGKGARLDELDFLNNIVIDLSVDEKSKTIARISRLFLGHHDDVLEILQSLIAEDALNAEYITILLASASESESFKIVNYLANQTVDQCISVTAISRSGCHKFIPFLTEFLKLENTQHEVLVGLTAMFDEDLLTVLPYDVFFGSSEIIWENIDTEQLGLAISDWYHSSAKVAHWPGRVLAGSRHDINQSIAVWSTGNNAQRQAANLHLALNDPEYVFNSEIALWGGR